MIDSNFYPIIDGQVNDLERNLHNYYCLDSPETVGIRGNYNSQSAKVLEIELDFCKEDSKCKTGPEIEKQLKGAHLVLVVNHIRFDSTHYK